MSLNSYELNTTVNKNLSVKPKMSVKSNISMSVNKYSTVMLKNKGKKKQKSASLLSGTHQGHSRGHTHQLWVWVSLMVGWHAPKKIQKVLKCQQRSPQEY